MPDRIFVSGISLPENGFEQEMAQALDIPTQRTNLLRDVNIKLDHHPTQSWNSDLMDSALALALIEIAGIKSVNFRKGPFAVARRWAEHRKSLIKSGILATAVLLLALFNVMIDFYVKQTKLNNLNQQIHATFKSTLPHIKKIADLFNIYNNFNWLKIIRKIGAQGTWEFRFQKLGKFVHTYGRNFRQKNGMGLSILNKFC